VVVAATSTPVLALVARGALNRRCREQVVMEINVLSIEERPLRGQTSACGAVVTPLVTQPTTRAKGIDGKRALTWVGDTGIEPVTSSV
jgi:hypothetical protein